MKTAMVAFLVSLTFLVGCDDLTVNGVPSNTDCEDAGDRERARQGCYLSCDARYEDDVNQRQQCRQTCSRVCSGALQNSTKDERLLFASLKPLNITGQLVLVQAFQPNSNASEANERDPTECSTECTGGGGACLRAEFRSEDGMGAKVAAANEILATKESRIPKRTFETTFGVENDPCSRTDTFLSDGSLFNAGDACTLFSSPVQARETRFEVSVHLPAVIQGKRRIEGKQSTFTFDDIAFAPDLDLGRGQAPPANQFDQDFGGSVLQVVTEDNRAIIATTRGCVSIKLL